jgi:hypothetical protein
MVCMVSPKVPLNLLEVTSALEKNVVEAAINF